ncbi:MAG: hypothetical protein NPIRA05_08770 [Nitrospirales bacterium]|nr:MAG: hypothetical protein NPIRA05_08770 [Nitrospirales bacterium]
MSTDDRDRRLIWFSRGVTVVLILVCNGLLVFGWWMSGLNLDVALSKPELYDVSSHYCVKVTFMKVVGVERPMKVCTEWLDLADPSGNTHTIREGQALTVGVNGALHYQEQRNEDYRLIGLVLFVILVMGSGMWAKQYVIAQYVRRQDRRKRPVA